MSVRPVFARDLSIFSRIIYSECVTTLASRFVKGFWLPNAKTAQDYIFYPGIRESMTITRSYFVYAKFNNIVFTVCGAMQWSPVRTHW